MKTTGRLIGFQPQSKRNEDTRESGREENERTGRMTGCGSAAALPYRAAKQHP